ncbi:MAG: V4R domain-containing protein [Pseudomonadota bacterium]
MFKEERENPAFEWGMIGNISEGRPNLGSTVDVAVYRLMQFTMRDVMIQRLGVETADRILHEAGELAGREFCKALVPPSSDFDAFLLLVQNLLKELRIGIVRVESFDREKKKITLTVAEDLDCSGLPACDETICTYDEGFLSGLVSEHTGTKFLAKEVDCWCSGDRVCRFQIEPAA